MNPIVIYASKYGAAKKYAEHIAKNLNCKALSLKEAQNMPLDAYDAVVFGGGIYVSKLNGAKFIVQNFDKLKGKKLAVFMTSLTPAEETKILQSYIDASFPAEIQSKIKVYPFGGGMNINKLSFLHRPLIRGLAKMLAKKPPAERTDAESSMLAMLGGVADGKPADCFDANAAAPLIAFIKE